MRSFGTWWKGLRDTLGARHEPYQIRKLADLYWHALLAAAFIILILVFIYSTWILQRILDDLGAAPDTGAPPPPALDRSQLSATVRAFDERKAQFENLKVNAPPSVKDPNI